MVESLYVFSLWDIVPYFGVLVLLFALRGVRGGDYYIYLVMFGFAAVRYGVGYDYYAYVDIVESGVKGATIEPMGRLVAWVAREVGCTQLFFVAFAFVTLYPIYYVVRRESSDSALSMILYYIVPIFYLESFSIVRNAAAYSLVFLAVYFLVKRRYFLYVVWMVVAVMFHYSALVGLLFIPLCLFKFSRWLAVLFFFGSLFAGEILVGQLTSSSPDTLIMMKLTSYAAEGKELGTFMKFYIGALAVMNLWYWRRLVGVDSKNRYWLSFVNFGAMLWFLFGFDHTLSLRLSSFFILFEILLVPSFFRIFGAVKARMVVAFFVMVYLSGFYINVVGYDYGEKMSYIPYQTVLWGEDFLHFKPE